MRRAMTVLAVVGLAMLMAGPAWAQENKNDDDLVVLNGPVHVVEGDIVHDLVLFHGSLVVDGTVTGDLVAFDATVTINGAVNGDVTVFHGNVHLTATARVGGDLSARNPAIDPGATVAGRNRVAPSFEFRRFRNVARFAVWLAVSVSMLLLGIILLGLIPRAFDAVFDAARSSVGPSIGWGFAILFGVPIGAILALVTLVGIPLGIGVLLGLVFLFSAGYVFSTWLLGRLLVRPPGHRFLALLAGWAILRALAFVPILGGLLWFAATVFGLGVMVVALWRARRGPTTVVPMGGGTAAFPPGPPTFPAPPAP
jgi:Polymer-forming cytoskeletal